MNLLYSLSLENLYWVYGIKPTDNPLYIDTRYNDKIRYNDNLTVTKLSLER